MFQVFDDMIHTPCLLSENVLNYDIRGTKHYHFMKIMALALIIS